MVGDERPAAPGGRPLHSQGGFDCLVISLARFGRPVEHDEYGVNRGEGDHAERGCGDACAVLISEILNQVEGGPSREVGDERVAREEQFAGGDVAERLRAAPSFPSSQTWIAAKAWYAVESGEEGMPSFVEHGEALAGLTVCVANFDDELTVFLKEISGPGDVGGNDAADTEEREDHLRIYGRYHSELVEHTGGDGNDVVLVAPKPGPEPLTVFEEGELRHVLDRSIGVPNRCTRSATLVLYRERSCISLSTGGIP